MTAVSSLQTIRRAADGVLSEMDEMPVGEVSVDRQILRHRAEHDAIARRDARIVIGRNSIGRSSIGRSQARQDAR